MTLSSWRQVGWLTLVLALVVVLLPLTAPTPHPGAGGPARPCRRGRPCGGAGR